MKQDKLKLKIGNPEEVFWNKVILETKASVEGLERGLKFNKAVLIMAEAEMKKAKK